MKMETADTSPAFNIKRDSPVKMPVYLLISMMVVTAMGTMIWADLRRDLAEASRVNAAQDLRFTNIESSIAEYAVLKNDVRWLEERQRRP
jgi:hypothetical protein